MDKRKAKLKISFKKYFPKGRSVYFFDPNVIVSKFPFYQSNHTKTLFELERIVRGIDEDQSRTIILLGKNFYLKVLILNYFFNNMYGDYLEFLHDLSFSSYFKPSYGMKFDLFTYMKASKTSAIPSTKRRLKLQFLLINPLKILEYKFTDLLTIKLFRIFLSAGPPLLEKYLGKRLLKYLQKTIVEKNIVTDISGKKKRKRKRGEKGEQNMRGMFFEQDKQKFFGFLKFVTETLKFQTEDINHFLEMMGMILRLCSPRSIPPISKSTMRRMGEICDFPKGETNNRILACFVHRHLQFWVVRKINKLFRKHQIHHHFISQIVLLPELHESAFNKSTKLGRRTEEEGKREEEEEEEDDDDDDGLMMMRRKKKKIPSSSDSSSVTLTLKKEDLHPFQDLSYNILTEHTYVVSFHGITEAVRFAQSLRLLMRIVTTLNDRKFYLMKNLKIYFMNHRSELEILESQRMISDGEEEEDDDDDDGSDGNYIRRRRKRMKKKKNRRRKKRETQLNSRILSRSFLVDHSFGKFRYDMKDFLYRRKWSYLYDHLMTNVNNVFCELDLEEEVPLLILAEPSNQEILDNYFIIKFLLNRIITDEKKKLIQKNDILEKIILIQCIFRGREEREEYQVRYRRYQMKELVKIRRRYAARKIQHWWRYWSARRKERILKSTIKIQRWFRKCLESRKDSAARIIQFHCRQYLRRKVDRWVDGLLVGSVKVIQRKYRSYKRTDLMLKRRDHLSNYFSFLSPQALSTDKLLLAKHRGGAITSVSSSSSSNRGVGEGRGRRQRIRGGRRIVEDYDDDDDDDDDDDEDDVEEEEEEDGEEYFDDDDDEEEEEEDYDVY